MNANTLLADPTAIEIEKFVSDDDKITVVVRAIQKTANCPKCDKSSSSLKTRYIRQLADLPWHGVAVRLELNTRKFRCRNEICPQKVFCERLTKVAVAYARRTVRLMETLTLLAFALGGRGRLVRWRKRITMVDGRQTTTSFKDDSIEYVVTLIDSLIKNYFLFNVALLNKFSKRFILRPSDFSIRANGKIYNAVEPETVAHLLENRGRLRLLFAGLTAQESANQANAARNHALNVQTVFENEMACGVVFFKKENFGDEFVLLISINDAIYEVPYKDK